MHDELRDAWRGLRAAPGTSALALVILTLGIAAATVTFSVVDTVALRRLPLPEAGRLAVITRSERTSPRFADIAPQDFFTWQAQTPAFEGVAGFGPWPLSFAAGDVSEALTAFRMTANLFDVLRVRPALGGTFTAANEVAGGDQVAIISHGLWQRRFGGDATIVGRAVTFGKETRQIVGVMPAGFTFPIGPEKTTDAWVPYVPRPQEHDHGFFGRSYFLTVIGRLRPGATLEQAREQVSLATASVVAAYPNRSFWKDSRPVVLPLHDFVVGSGQRWLVLVLGAVGLVLIVAYVNVANLLLARATARAREFSVRAALGAGRARIARMLVLESLMLSVAAAAIGIVLAVWGVSIATANLPLGLARASAIAVDMRVLTTAILAAVATGVVFGVIPAWRGSRADVMTVMKEGGGAIGAGRGRARWQRLLLVAELAFVVTLLVATSLVVTSFVQVLRVDLGFTRGNLIGFDVIKLFRTVPEGERQAVGEAFVADVLARATAVPGVSGAAFVNGGLPLYGSVASYSISVDGYGQARGADAPVLRSVTSTYFEVVGIPVLLGHVFDGTERPGTPRVMVINEEAARRFFGGRNPVGEPVEFRATTMTVIGVVRSLRLLGPETDLRPEAYVPLYQEEMGGSYLSGDVIVRQAPEAAVNVAAIQEAVRTATGAPRPPIPKNLDEQFRTLTADRRFNAGVMMIFGVLALAMAAAGVYGLTSFVVAQQTRAIGVRLALGATAGRIFRGVLAESGRLLAAAMVLGLLGGWAASRLFASVVFGVTGGEAWLYAAVTLVLGVTVVLATLLPARRASRVDPLVALRTD